MKTVLERSFWIPGLECEGPPSEDEKGKESDEDCNPEESDC